jgi:hypothetical protein
MKTKTSRTRPRQKINPKVDKFPKHLDREREPTNPDPTEAEITERCAEIRQGWSILVRISRWMGHREDLRADLLRAGFSPSEINVAFNIHQAEFGTRERRRVN